VKRRARTAAEEDVTAANGRLRRYYCYLQRPGATSAIKRQIRRRERREGKDEIRRE